MAEASPYFAIRALSLTTGDWTPVVAPINCNYWVVRNQTNSMLICTDASNPAGTQDTISQGTQEGVYEKQNPLPVVGFKYPAGTVFGYLQSIGGSSSAVATFAQ